MHATRVKKKKTLHNEKTKKRGEGETSRSDEIQGWVNCWYLSFKLETNVQLLSIEERLKRALVHQFQFLKRVDNIVRPNFLRT